MFRARFVIPAMLALALATPVWSFQRALTRDGQRIPDNEVPLDLAQGEFDDLPIDPALLEIVDRLGSEDFDTREAATKELEASEFTRPQIYAVLDERQLNAEQRHRLLSHIITMITSAPRGAVGISMRWVNEQFGEPGYVVVERIIPGFDAFRVLEFRDHITHVDGNPLMRDGDFVRIVQSKKPGEAITLTVDRARRKPDGDQVFDANGRAVYDTHEFTVQLGSLNELRDMPGNNRVIEANNDKLSNELKWAQNKFSAARYIDVQGDVLPMPTFSPIGQSEVDDEPVIQAFITQLREVQQGRADVAVFDAQHEMWNRVLQEMSIAAREKDASAAERTRRILVLQRFAELMNIVYDQR